MASYGQFCPVAKAMELLDERWTLLVLREVLAGSRRFSDLRRGVPRMSPTLLSKRLRTLSRAGLLEREERGNGVHYFPTEACEEVRPIVEAIGAWGIRWIGELGDEDLDPHLLVWDMHRNVDLEQVPDGRTVLQVCFTDVDAGARDWWLVIEPTEVDVCDEDPGYGVDVALESTLRTLTEIWRGDRGWQEALRAGDLELHGPERMRRALPGWMKLSMFARVPRQE